MKLRKKVFGSCFIALLTLSTSAYAATTDTNVASVGVKAGTISIDYVETTGVAFPSITTNGMVQTVTAPLEKTQVVDNTGTGNGWTVSVAASQFTEVAAGGPSSGKTLPLGSLTYKGVASTSQAISTVTNSDVVIDGGSAVNIATAAVGEGSGITDILHNQPSLALSVNTANNYVNPNNLDGSGATPFQSTLTWTVVTGP